MKRMQPSAQRTGQPVSFDSSFARPRASRTSRGGLGALFVLLSAGLPCVTMACAAVPSNTGFRGDSETSAEGGAGPEDDADDADDPGDIAIEEQSAPAPKLDAGNMGTLPCGGAGGSGGSAGGCGGSAGGCGGAGGDMPGGSAGAGGVASEPPGGGSGGSGAAGADPGGSAGAGGVASEPPGGGSGGSGATGGDPGGSAGAGGVATEPPPGGGSGGSGATGGDPGGSGGAGGVETQPPPCIPLDDYNDCTDSLCLDGVLVRLPTAIGTPCNTLGGSVCDGQGSCVECNNALDCNGAQLGCYDNHCIEFSCGDWIANGSETDVDCGGSSCLPCPDFRRCLVDSDCMSGVCLIDATETMHCAPPVCGDGVLNGSEQCDDGGHIAGDGCSPDCTIELGFVCGGTRPTQCVSVGGQISAGN